MSCHKLQHKAYHLKQVVLQQQAALQQQALVAMDSAYSYHGTN